MRVARLKNKLFELYESDPQTAVLLLGAPGIGKSETVREVAQEIAMRESKEFVDYSDDRASEILRNPEKYFLLVDFRLSEVEPSDLIGIPRVQEIDSKPYVQYVPLLWARCLQASSGILFLDEITNVQRDDVISVAYKLALDRKVGQVSINGKTFIVAAGNSPEESALARLLPAPLLNRFRVYRVDPPSVTDWANYMDARFGESWDKRVLAFLYAHEGENYLIQRPDDAETLQQFPTPRSWTKLAAVSSKLRGDELYEDAASLVGREIATKLKAFVEARVDIDALMADPEGYAGLSLDQRFMLAIQLAQRVARMGAKDKRWLPLSVKILKDRGELFIVFARALRKRRVEALRLVRDAAPEAFMRVAEAAFFT